MCEYSQWALFTRLNFFKAYALANKLECFTLPNLSSPVYCNTLAYWAHSYVTKKLKSRAISTTLHFSIPYKWVDLLSGWPYHLGKVRS
jgi:hypothetical protein